MPVAIKTPAEWVSRQTKCAQCCYNETKECMQQRCFRSEGVEDIYFVESEE